MILRAAKENEWLIKGFARVLGMKPDFQYQDKQGQYVTEWRMSGREARWSSMQGVPIYKNAKRLYVTEEYAVVSSQSSVVRKPCRCREHS